MPNENITPPFCRGACCRNPFGVCAHKRACTFHESERKTQAEAQAAQDWVNEMTRAGSVNSHKMTQRNKRG